MTTRGQNLRSSTPGQKPAAGTRLPGEIWMTWPDKQLGVIDASKTAQPMIAVRFFSTAANYASGDFVVQAGGIWVAKSAITAGAFNSTQWSELAYLTDIPALYVLPTASTTVLGGVKVDGVSVTISSGVISSAGLVTVSAVAPSPVQNGALWYDLVGGQLYAWVNDGTSSQWVIAVNQNVAGGIYLPLSGGTLTGPLVGTSAQFSGVVNSAGGTLTGGLAGTTLSMSGAVTFSGANVVIAYNGSTDSSINLGNNRGGNSGTIYWALATGNVGMYHQHTNQNFWMDNNAGNFNISGASAFKPGGGSWTATSDARIKTVQGDYAPGLEEVLQLRPVVYTYKGNYTTHKGEPSPQAKVATDQKPYVGLIAQEVEPVFPGMVAQRAGFIDGVAVDDIRELDANELIYALVNAVKTLAAEVNALKQGAR